MAFLTRKTDARSLYYRIGREYFDQSSYPHYPLDPDVSLGDYGHINSDGSFSKSGNIYANGIVSIDECQISTPKLKLDDKLLNYGCNYSTEASAEATKIVTVKVEFNAKSHKSLLINLHNLKESHIESLGILEQRLVNLYDRGEWSSDYIVTEILTAERMHYYAYAGSNGTLVMSAKIDPTLFNIDRHFGKLSILSSFDIDANLLSSGKASRGAIYNYKVMSLKRPYVFGEPELTERGRGLLDSASSDSPLEGKLGASSYDEPNRESSGNFGTEGVGGL